MVSQYDFENFGTRLMKADAAAASIHTVMELMECFDESCIEKNHYGSAENGNRTYVWTVTMMVTECIRPKEEGGA